MEYDVIIIGGGLSGLTAGSLLANRNLKVAVIDKMMCPQLPYQFFVENAVGFQSCIKGVEVIENAERFSYFNAFFLYRP